MFVIILKYVKSLEAVDKELKMHIEYINKYFSLDHFVCTGTKRAGGVILCRAKDRHQVTNIIKQDPFYIKAIAEYEIIEFIPTKCASGFEALLR